MGDFLVVLEGVDIIGGGEEEGVFVVGIVWVMMRRRVFDLL